MAPNNEIKKAVDEKCTNPCDPCHFGGFEKNDTEAKIEVPEKAMADCRAIAKENRDPVCNLSAEGGSNGPGSGAIGNPPCYLPQAEDSLAGKKKGDDDDDQMGPIGPWATGKVDWGPLAGLTGTRPVVSSYSITRYSEGEWRQRNADLLNDNYMTQDETNLVRFQTIQCMHKDGGATDKMQADNKKRLEQWAQIIHRWKCELEKAIAAAQDELFLLKSEYMRLKQAMAILMVPESIAQECLNIRTSRMEPDLVRDAVEEELIKEVALVAEIRDLFTRTLNDLSSMIVEEKTAKMRLEADWSDKSAAFDAESLNVALNNRSNIILFYPGSTRYAENQSTPEYYEHFTRESLEQSERTRQKAVNLRGTLDAILTNAARDLRSQADKLELALSKKIQCTEELRIKLEMELKKILQQQVDMEKIVNDMENAIRNMDYPMKVAQTRLNNKLQVPRVENCREGSQLGLIEEVKNIAKTVSVLTGQMNKADSMKAGLVKMRGLLEREIMIKLKTLQIDKERMQLIRSHYPSSSALTGN